jgi:hypothetical protein
MIESTWEQHDEGPSRRCEKQKWCSQSRKWEQHQNIQLEKIWRGEWRGGPYWRSGQHWKEQDWKELRIVKEACHWVEAQNGWGRDIQDRPENHVSLPSAGTERSQRGHGFKLVHGSDQVIEEVTFEE